MAGFMNAFSQQDPLEKKLKIKELDPSLLYRDAGTLTPGVNCRCEKNIIKDGIFTTVIAPGSNISSASPFWKPDMWSPQWSKQKGCCDSGYVQMWGNQTVGESLRQNGINIVAGRKYRITFCGRFLNQTGPNNPFVRFRFRAFNGVGNNPNGYANVDVIGVSSPNITSTSWATYTVPIWTATNNFNSISINAENGNTQNDGNFVSWGQMDNLCIEDVSCNCKELPQAPVISGPTCFCLPKPCNQTLTYSVPNYGGRPCFSYNWNVTNANGQPVTVAGQGTNQINFNCSGLTAGTYNIKVTIRCEDKVVTSTIQLVVCKKPDPAFSMSSNGSSVTFTSASGCNNYWFLVKDNDNNCAYTSGETYQFLSTNPATFTGLVNNQQYVVYHFVSCKCGNSCYCWSSKRMCFKWLPSQMMKTANGAKGVELINEKSLNTLGEIPKEFKKDLPSELRTEINEK